MLDYTGGGVQREEWGLAWAVGCRRIAGVCGEGNHRSRGPLAGYDIEHSTGGLNLIFDGWHQGKRLPTSHAILGWNRSLVLSYRIRWYAEWLGAPR